MLRWDVAISLERSERLDNVLRVIVGRLTWVFLLQRVKSRLTSEACFHNFWSLSLQQQQQQQHHNAHYLGRFAARYNKNNSPIQTA